MIKEWAKSIGEKDPFSAKVYEMTEDKWLEQIISYAAAKPALMNTKIIMKQF